MSTNTERTIAVLVNPAAGKGRAKISAEKVAEKLRNIGVGMKLYFTQWPETLTGFSDVFLVGGDGTLNYFINAYPVCNLPVSLFAAGSGNDFAWKLNGKRTWEESFDIAMNGDVIPVDAGNCNKRYFINGVGIGFDGEVVKSMGRKRFISAGHIAYLITVLKEILFYKSKTVRIIMDSVHTNSKVFMISIANGSRYGGGFLVAPHAIVDDGLLDAVTVNKLGLLARLKYLPAIERGKHLHLSFMHATKCKTIRIDCDTIIAAHLDGELMEAASFDIRILPGLFHFRVNGRAGNALIRD